jgi:hypothetical protein
MGCAPASAPSVVVTASAGMFAARYRDLHAWRGVRRQRQRIAAKQRGRGRDHLAQHARDERIRHVGIAFVQRQAAHRGHGFHIPMPAVRERFHQEAEPAAVDDRHHAPSACKRNRIDGDVARLRILDQLILDHVRQCLAQTRPFQRRQQRGGQQQVARGDDQHRRARTRQEPERCTAGALCDVALVQQQKRQLRQIPFFGAHRRIARRQ